MSKAGKRNVWLREGEYQFEIGNTRPDGLRNVWKRVRVWPGDEVGPGTWVIVKVVGGFQEALEWIRERERE